MEKKDDVITDEFRDQIKRDYVHPTFKNDVKTYVNDRKNCRKWGGRFELCGKILTGVATVCAFLSAGVAGYERTGALISGGIGMLAVLFQNLSSTVMKRAKESTENLNHTLQSLKIDIEIPTDKYPVIHHDLDNL